MAGQGKAMAEDKAELLRSLAIDRTADARPRRRWLAPAMIGVVAAAAVAAFMVPQWRDDAPGERAPSAPAGPAATSVVATAAVPAATGTSPAAPPRRGLSASGYVVARRKATVAAEITGKVVSVAIEEGMVVK